MATNIFSRRFRKEADTACPYTDVLAWFLFCEVVKRISICFRPQIVFPEMFGRDGDLSIRGFMQGLRPSEAHIFVGYTIKIIVRFSENFILGFTEAI